MIRDSIKKDSFADRLEALIPYGEENAITTKELSNILRLPVRQTRDEVLRARLEGKLICSSRYGYFRPKSEEELLAFYLWMRNRCFVGLRSLKRTREELIHAGLICEAGKGMSDHGKERAFEQFWRACL